ncbi:MAG: hypothetical protein OXH15_11285 [Gammaproteobacteria bacterium]|nr:hypothetical protein [Gammaproteobacteria bacterium]
MAVAGTRIKAMNNQNRNLTRGRLEKDLKKADERLESYLRQIDDADAEDPDGGPVVADLQGKIAKLRERRAALDARRSIWRKAVEGSCP